MGCDLVFAKRWLSSVPLPRASWWLRGGHCPGGSLSISSCCVSVCPVHSTCSPLWERPGTERPDTKVLPPGTQSSPSSLQAVGGVWAAKAGALLAH